jgi:hypothetical protein
VIDAREGRYTRASRTLKQGRKLVGGLETEISLITTTVTKPSPNGTVTGTGTVS